MNSMVRTLLEPTASLQQGHGCVNGSTRHLRSRGAHPPFAGNPATYYSRGGNDVEEVRQHKTDQHDSTSQSFTIAFAHVRTLTLARRTTVAPSSCGKERVPSESTSRAMAASLGRQS
jgi:hypothetical protein